MKLQVYCRYTKEPKGNPWNLEKIVEGKVDGSDYDSGELETMRATTRNQTMLLAKIIEKLNLSDEELTDWLAEYNETLKKVTE